MHVKQKEECGFTLVEIAVVLVIIALLLSGVLVGQSLIKTGEIRRVITELNQYNAGATTFNAKYGGLPGDIILRRVQQYNFANVGLDGTDGRADGDGVLEHGTIAANKQGIGGENALFWVHLSQAGLIPGDFNTADGSIATAVTGNAVVMDYLPTSQLRDFADYHIFGESGRNYYYIAGITAFAATTGLPTEDHAISPLEAEQIDAKLDDSYPLFGTIRARDDIATAATPATPAAGVCVSDAADNPYNLNEAFMHAISCRLRIRADF